MPQNPTAAGCHILNHPTSSGFKMDSLMRHWGGATLVKVCKSHLHFIVGSLLRKKKNGV